MQRPIPFLPVVSPDAGPQVIRMMVSKDMATEWLKLNIDNRKPAAGRIAQITEMIDGGSWDENLPTPISFADDGTLIDGQHRLMGLVGSTISGMLMMWVSYNVPKKTAQVIDCGWGRSLGHRMGTDKNTVAMVQWFKQLISKNAAMSPERFQDTYARHKAGIEWAGDWTSAVGFCRTQLKCAVILLWEKDKAKGEEFRRILLDPDSAVIGHPAYILRKKITEWLMSRKMPPQMELYKYALSATAAALEGRSLTKLYARDIA